MSPGGHDDEFVNRIHAWTRRRTGRDIPREPDGYASTGGLLRLAQPPRRRFTGRPALIGA